MAQQILFSCGRLPLSISALAKTDAQQRRYHEDFSSSAFPSSLSFKGTKSVQLSPIKATTAEKEEVARVKKLGEKPEVDEVEEATKKWGLEVGLWKALTREKGGEGEKESGVGEKKAGSTAKDLLARYGGAYLVTSISLSVISFSICYFLIDSGVDVPALLETVGIHTDATGEKVGTLALAYAAHKAASPIRFPPTVALTPIIANLLKKKNDDEK